MAFKPETNLETHRVFNQPEPRGSLALWAEDAPLRQTVERLAPAHAGHVAGFAATGGAR